jgi:hypothetical protein
MSAAMVSLATITLGSAASTVTFSSIPATYRDLRIVANVTGTGAILDSDYVKFNTSTADFTTVQMYGNGSSAGSNTGTSGRVSNYENTVGRPYVWTLDIMDYSATDKHKSYLSRFNADDAGVGAFAGRWAQTTALNAIQIYPATGQYAAGSTFSLYGIVSA